MSISTPPTFILDIFIPYYWNIGQTEITQDYADAHYLKFPVGQGTQSIPNLTVSGTTTLANTSVSTLTASGTSNLGVTNTDNLSINSGTAIYSIQGGTISSAGYETTLTFPYALPSTNYQIFAQPLTATAGNFYQITFTTKTSSSILIRKQVIQPPSTTIITTADSTDLMWFLFSYN